MGKIVKPLTELTKKDNFQGDQWQWKPWFDLKIL